MIASKPRRPILFKTLLLFCLQLLDDNRELFIPETQDTVVAHPMFMLFATQNPPGHYGGRKVPNVYFLSEIRLNLLSEFYSGCFFNMSPELISLSFLLMSSLRLSFRELSVK